MTTASRGGPHVSARSRLDRRVFLVTQVIRRGNHWAATLADPRSPVLPPGGVHQLRVRLPFMRIGGKIVVHPVLGLRIWRIDNSRDVTGRTQHESALATQQLRGLVAGGPWNDMVVHGRQDVGVDVNEPGIESIAVDFELSPRELVA